MTLDRDLERILRETSVRTRRQFKKVLNDTPRAGHDPAGFNNLPDDLEGEAFLETSRKLMERSP
jgi:hypothetical protein